MNDIYAFILLLNKINFDIYNNSSDYQKFEYICHLLNGNYRFDNIAKIKNIIYCIDTFIYNFNRAVKHFS